MHLNCHKNAHVMPQKRRRPKIDMISVLRNLMGYTNFDLSKSIQRLLARSQSMLDKLSVQL